MEQEEEAMTTDLELPTPPTTANDDFSCQNQEGDSGNSNIRPTGQKYAITPSWSKVLLLVNIVVGILNVKPVLEPI